MTTKSTVAPVGLAVALAMAKKTLKLEPDDTDLDDLLTLAIRAITRDAEKELLRSLITQGWRLTLDEFSDALRLDFPPLISVQSIRYYDTDDVLQTLDPADYLVDTVTEPGYVVPGRGKSWPDTSDRVNAVMVDYTAGYGLSSDFIPENVQFYILYRLLEQFDAPTREFKETSASKYANSLIEREQVFQ